MERVGELLPGPLLGGRAAVAPCGKGPALAGKHDDQDVFVGPGLVEAADNPSMDVEVDGIEEGRAIELDEGNRPLDPVQDPGLVGFSAVLATKGIVGRHRVLLAGRVRRADRSEGLRPPRPRSADPTGGLSSKAIWQELDLEAGVASCASPGAGPMPIGVPPVAIGATDEPIFHPCLLRRVPDDDGPSLCRVERRHPFHLDEEVGHGSR